MWCNSSIMGLGNVMCFVMWCVFIMQLSRIPFKIDNCSLSAHKKEINVGQFMGYLYNYLDMQYTPLLVYLIIMNFLNVLMAQQLFIVSWTFLNFSMAFSPDSCCAETSLVRKYKTSFGVEQDWQIDPWTKDGAAWSILPFTTDSWTGISIWK